MRKLNAWLHDWLYISSAKAYPIGIYMHVINKTIYSQDIFWVANVFYIENKSKSDVSSKFLKFIHLGPVV
jgi:hypothetical protein